MIGETGVMDRRTFIKRIGLTGFASGLVGGVVYPVLEAKWCRLTRQIIQLPKLPKPFHGTTIAVLADIHHGPFVPVSYIRHVVTMTNAMRPDIIALVGDYVHRNTHYIAPGMDELRKLQPRVGCFAVRGNHDNRDYHGNNNFRSLSEAALAEAKIPDLNNRGIWLERRGTRLRIGGVGDLWTDRQDLDAALGETTNDDAAIVLSHNPDFVEQIEDRRVGLVLSGHTHGGQVVVPGVGAPIVPSRYGQKYLHGLVQGPCCRVFVSRGVGTVSPPIRFLCRPEIVLITLV
jgi:uncharacterized protein